MLEHDPQSIQVFLHDKVLRTWEQRREPYLLSFVATDLKDIGVDYQSVLLGEKLKAFVARTQGKTTYRVVQHPTQRAKVGLIPFDAHFDFQSEPKDSLETAGSQADTAHDPDERSRPSRADTIVGFLRLLGQLPANELHSINIPVSALARLLK